MGCLNGLTTKPELNEEYYMATIDKQRIRMLMTTSKQR